jgi:hypothetical protein
MTTAFTKLEQVKVYGAITHGTNNVIYEDDEIKELVGKKAGAYGRHWVYGDRHGRRSLMMHECDILVVHGPASNHHLTFVGRDGLKQCLAFLGTFERDNA